MAWLSHLWQKDLLSFVLSFPFFYFSFVFSYTDFLQSLSAVDVTGLGGVFLLINFVAKRL